uniref:CIMAP1 family member D n=1 Tax=Chinchilla lanigera TaxID=34839 RepID=A0A8C2VE21_CHILA
CLPLLCDLRQAAVPLWSSVFLVIKRKEAEDCIVFKTWFCLPLPFAILLCLPLGKLLNCSVPELPPLLNVNLSLARWRTSPPQDASPGPIYLLDPKVTRFGRSCTPAYSMQGRAKSRGLEVTPGPGAYSPEKVPPVRQRNPPAFTLGLRLCPKPPDTSAPAPNAYTMPPLWGSQILVKPRSPSYTVVGRTPPARLLQDPAEIPGPGQYDSPDPNAYRQRRPAFTMLGRPRAPRPPEETPGPGSHSPEQVTVNRARAPAYSMGIRHSKRADTAP